MREAWQGAPVPLLADGDARTTAGNALAVAAAAKEVGADEVLLVTSSWHARRARLLVRAALGSKVKLEVVTPARTRPAHLVGRELACLLPTGVYLAFARRSRGHETPDTD